VIGDNFCRFMCSLGREWRNGGRKRITAKAAISFGTYGWSGGAEKELKKHNGKASYY